MAIKFMEYREFEQKSEDDEVVLITNSRIITASTVMLVLGTFGGLLGLYTLSNYREFNLPASIFAVIIIFGGAYAIYFAVKCLFVTRVQLQFNKDGLSYRDVRKHVIGRNLTGIGLGFYINTKFYFLPYANIENVSLEKVTIGCNLIRIDTKLNEVIYLPVLLDSCKEVDQLANLINEKRR